MKKNLFILAVAGLALASCSSDETIASQATSQANEISFRPLVSGVTRAADIVEGPGFTSFKAYATNTSTSTVYFSEETFTRQSDGSYTSSNKHYWPSSGALDFYAYAPVSNNQITHSTPQTLTFSVQPSATVSNQVDLVVANTNNKSKETSGAGVPLNFRHAESKVVVKFKNGQSSLKIDVQAFKIVNVDGNAVYTYSATSTDTKDAAQLSGGWSGNDDGFNQTYTVTPDATNTIGANTTTAVYIQNNGTASTTVNAASEMILIPQTTTTSSVYSGSSVNSTFPEGKTYIAVKMVIKNNDGTGTVIADATTDGKWAIWPVAFSWTPGKKYTYIVDLGDGGYWEKKVKSDAATSLDPVLDGAEIKFVTVTVDNWTPYDGDGNGSADADGDNDTNNDPINVGM